MEMKPTMERVYQCFLYGGDTSLRPFQYMKLPDYIEYVLGDEYFKINYSEDYDLFNRYAVRK